MIPYPNRQCRPQFIQNAWDRLRVAAGVVLLSAPVSNVHADVSWPPPEPVQQRIEAAVEFVDRLQTLVPKPHADMTDRAFALDFDFDAAIEHVTNGIHYQPYRGVLRGPDGAAVIGAGNAWDQALLLAELVLGVPHKIE